MNIDYLKTFFRVAETQSFTQAARDLYLTQPAVSQQIQNLENSLKVTLFDRSRRKILLTEEGRLLFAYAQKIFSLVQDLENAFESLSDLGQGHINIGATAIMGSYYLPWYISRFHELHPGVRIALSVENSHDVAELVHQDKLDLGFGGSSLQHPGLTRHFMHREPLIWVCAPSMRLASEQGALEAHKLLEEALLLREPGTRVTNKVLEWLKTHGCERMPALFTVNNMEALKALVAQGMGITVLPRSAAWRDIEAGLLVQLAVADFDLHTDYFMLYVPGRSMSHAVKSFLNLLYSHGVPLPEELLG